MTCDLVGIHYDWFRPNRKPSLPPRIRFLRAVHVTDVSNAASVIYAMMNRANQTKASLEEETRSMGMREQRLSQIRASPKQELLISTYCRRLLVRQRGLCRKHLILQLYLRAKAILPS